MNKDKIKSPYASIIIDIKSKIYYIKVSLFKKLRAKSIEKKNVCKTLIFMNYYKNY